MKFNPYILITVIVSYFFLMSCSDPDHSHEMSHTNEINEHDHVTEIGVDDHGHDEIADAQEHETDHDHRAKNSDDPDSEDAELHSHEAGLIEFNMTWERQVGLETDQAKRLPIDLLVTVPGQIIPNQNNIAVLTPFVESSVHCVFVNIGDRVKKGDILACLLSPEIGLLRAEYDKAKAEHDIKQQNYQRKQKLYNEKIISVKSFQEAELDLKVADVQFEYARKKLLAVGVSTDELEKPAIKHNEAVGATIHLRAPIDGIITSRDAIVGQKVEQSTRLLEIIDIKTVWLEADIFEKDLTQIKIGQHVNVSVSAYPEQHFSGNIFHIGNTLNDKTRTIKILVSITNRDEKLKPGMFATTNIIVGQKSDALVVPKEAILQDENLNIVFVTDEHGYLRRVVETGIISDHYAEIISGLDESDVIVTKGNYQLKSKSKMTAIDPHAGHNH